MSASVPVFRLGAYFAQLTEADGCVPVAVGDNFWESSISDLPPGRLVSMLDTGPAWTTWECHPYGEEFILQLDGYLTLWLEQDGRIEERRLRTGEFVIVPTGVWHTAEETKPGKALFITPGRDTAVRAR
jgi:mannose-6-phosphate isomerase-like protein (cupin superfamily)